MQKEGQKSFTGTISRHVDRCRTLNIKTSRTAKVEYFTSKNSGAFYEYVAEESDEISLCCEPSRLPTVTRQPTYLPRG